MDEYLRTGNIHRKPTTYIDKLCLLAILRAGPPNILADALEEAGENISLRD